MLQILFLFLLLKLHEFFISFCFFDFFQSTHSISERVLLVIYFADEIQPLVIGETILQFGLKHTDSKVHPWNFQIYVQG